jgi:hypothetical protein
VNVQFLLGHLHSVMPTAAARSMCESTWYAARRAEAFSLRADQRPRFPALPNDELPKQKATPRAAAGTAATCWARRWQPKDCVWNADAGRYVRPPTAVYDHLLQQSSTLARREQQPAASEAAVMRDFIGKEDRQRSTLPVINRTPRADPGVFSVRADRSARVQFNRARPKLATHRDALMAELVERHDTDESDIRLPPLPPQGTPLTALDEAMMQILMSKPAFAVQLALASTSPHRLK